MWSEEDFSRAEGCEAYSKSKTLAELVCMSSRELACLRLSQSEVQLALRFASIGFRGSVSAEVSLRFS